MGPYWAVHLAKTCDSPRFALFVYVDNNMLGVKYCRLDQEAGSLLVISVCSNGSKCGSSAIFDG